MGDWAAFYAAIVATGALFLEMRRWVESGPKLRISTMPEGQIATNLGVVSKTYIVVNVSNRGGTATTITHLAFCTYDKWWRRLLDRPSSTYIVPDPSPPGGTQRLPYLLEPGTRWMGMAEHDPEISKLVGEGKLWVQLFASHSDKPTYSHLQKPTPAPKGKKLG
ncbi:hypothetical protein HNQ96_003826 [Aminobacter lissarensis]|uniref:Uncharacterized protein n=1 Tax=Aminobacter carboxidus TaxID=376165 RepID=A0A8E1WGL3_9HYPH|nr:hypothetical protein [Aminobacter lissarensis]MBB6467943.1 hypothetical protein [Aminobacter lissarensis]